MSTIKMPPVIAVGFLLTLLSFAPHGAEATEPALAPVQLVQTGDHDMSCPALAAEINRLAAMDAAPAEVTPAAPKKKHGLGFSKVLGGAAPFIPGVGGIVGGAVLSTAATAAGGDASHGADEMVASSRLLMAKAAAGPSVAAQRKERLTAIFEAKRC